jgi:hypothetical protein
MTTNQKTEGTTEDHGRDFWMCGTGTDPQVAQIHDNYMLMISNTSNCK